MNKIEIFNELNRIIKIGEERIIQFHQTRKNIDSFGRVVNALFSKKVYRECYDELYYITNRIKEVYEILCDFEENNKEYFRGGMARYLFAYKEYLKCAKEASEKRLEIQRLILQVKMGKKSRSKAINIVKMMDEMKPLLSTCQEKAFKLNEAANKVKGEKLGTSVKY